MEYGGSVDKIPMFIIVEIEHHKKVDKMAHLLKRQVKRTADTKQTACKNKIFKFKWVDMEKEKRFIIVNLFRESS